MENYSDPDAFALRHGGVLCRRLVGSRWSYVTKVYPTETTREHSDSFIKTKCAIALVSCISLGWTIWLICLNTAPNETVNRVMKTKTFDYGSFWLLINAPDAMVVTATIGLSMVAMSYVGVVVKMATYRQNRAVVIGSLTKEDVLANGESTLDTTSHRTGSRSSSTINVATSLAHEGSPVATSLAHEGSPVRKTIKLGMKFVDLVLETLLLYQMLESGCPIELLGLFTGIVAANALSCAFVMFIPYERAPLAEILLDILFDFLVVICYPMTVLIYCFSAFTFDHAKFAINLEVFPMSWFEQDAKVIADPVEIAIIMESLKSLRIMSALDLLTRIGVNITLCLRLRHLVNVSQSPKRLHTGVYPKRQRITAGVLVLFTLLLVVFVEESVRTSRVACQPHPECVENAHRWTRLEKGSLRQCPCLLLIDQDIAPKTYAEWENPHNVTEKVAQLAATGDLQTLQLMNRYLAVLPDELKRCTNMRHIGLVYTKTEVLPSWFKTFTKLEFLHIETSPFAAMNYLPDDVFDAMSSLTFIHFGGYISMPQLPSFQGLANLKSLTLAVFVSLKELPSFDKVHHLERLVLVMLPALDTLPDFASIKNLKSFTTSDRGTWCCNGFIGDCNLNDYKCGFHPVWGTPPATCLPSNEVATVATRAAADRFASTICGPIFQADYPEGPPSEAKMALCNGILYQQCQAPGGGEAMCYNTRFMGIACTANTYTIEMRRRQIARKIGDPCDPEIEAWLGCK